MPTASSPPPSAREGPSIETTAEIPRRRPAPEPPGRQWGFQSVVCIADRSAAGRAVRRQGAAFVADDGRIEWIAPRDVAGQGYGVLIARCDGADLFVAGAGKDAYALRERASVPVLVARPCRLGTVVTDRILVACTGSPASERAANIAGLLAARHVGVVGVVPAPARDATMERAVAAGSRIVLDATGATPPILGRPVASECAIPALAASVGASLLVVPADTPGITSIVRCAGCSVLTVPARPRAAR